MRTVRIDLEDLLDLLSALEDYGADSGVVLTTFRDWMGYLTDSEIAVFADGFLSEERRAEGYGEEDAERARERLHEFRRRYNVPKSFGRTE